MNRLQEILSKPNQFALDGEIIIHVSNGEMTVLYNDGESLLQISGKTDEQLNEYIERLKASE
jgi:hypothetical protein